MSIIKTAMGKYVDISAYQAQIDKAIAVGNAKMNGRGDELGPGGQVIKKKEQIVADYHQNNSNAVKRVSLKDTELDVFLTPAEAVEKYTLPVEKEDKKKK